MSYLEIIEEAWKKRRSNLQDAEKSIENLLQEPMDTDTYHKAMTVKGMLEIYKNHLDNAEKKLLESNHYFKEHPSPLFYTRNCNSLGVLYITKGLYSEAILILKQGLEVARLHQIDEMTIFILYNITEIYKEMNAFDKAMSLLEEACQMNYDGKHVLTAALLSSLAYVYLNTKQLEQAEDYAQKAIKSANSQDLYTYGLCYMVLSEIAMLQDHLNIAEKYCFESLKAREKNDDQFGIANNYTLLAQIENKRMNYLKAIEFASKSERIIKDMDGLAILESIYSVFSHAYAGLNNFKKAYEYYELLNEAQLELYNQSLAQNMSIMASEQKYESLKRETEFYKLRNQELLEKNKLITTIADIGRNLVNKLDFNEIILNLYEHLNQFIQTHYIALGLLNDNNDLIYHVILNKNKVLSPKQVLQKDMSYGFKAIDRVQTIYMNDINEIIGTYVQLDDSLQEETSKSAVFCPMLIESKPIGVLSIQSNLPNAYSEQEITFIEGLAAYVAIAIDNAKKTDLLSRTVKELKSTQAALVKAETLASLGELVSGVAHELNTPIGSSLTMVSFLLQRNDILVKTVIDGKLNKSKLNHFLHTNSSVLNKTQEAIQQASEMIQSFKSLAIHQGNMVLNTLDSEALLQWINVENDDILKQNQVYLIFEIEPFNIKTYPTLIHEIFKQLILNSIHHGKANQIIIKCRQEGQYIYFHYEDNGIPISKEVIPYMFKPFFGTKKKDGLMGIGLHAVHNMITQIFQGTIEYYPHYYDIRIKNQI